MVTVIWVPTIKKSNNLLSYTNYIYSQKQLKFPQIIDKTE
jgi:hypothetical protein